ncbi:MCE family protein [Nocardioides sp. W3-2-3]|nr:MCE family protein [Nocardioides convexus]
MSLPDAGGLFVNSEVTYRGVQVGEVTDMDATAKGVDVTVEIKSGAPDIPADSTVQVRNRSAIGEQYLDLQGNDSKDLLADGDRLHGGEDALPQESVRGAAHRPGLRGLGALRRAQHRDRRVLRPVEGPQWRREPPGAHVAGVPEGRRRQLPRHRLADPQLPPGAADPGGLGECDHGVQQRPRAVLPDPRRLRRRPAHADRRDARRGPRTRCADQGRRPAAGDLDEQPGLDRHDLRRQRLRRARRADQGSPRPSASAGRPRAPAGSTWAWCPPSSTRCPARPATVARPVTGGPTSPTVRSTGRRAVPPRAARATCVDRRRSRRSLARPAVPGVADIDAADDLGDLMGGAR